MNILLTNSTHIYAGGEYYVLTLAKQLQNMHHAVVVSANPGHLLLKKCADAGIETLPVEYGDMSKVFSVGMRLRKEILGRSIDIIHSNANYCRTCAAIGAAFTPAKHVATIHSAHSIQHNITHWLRNRFGVAQFIAVAEAVKHVLATQDKIDPDRVTFIPNGVENDSAEYRKSARLTTRAKLGITDGTIVIGNVARLTEFKGHKFLLRTIAAVVETSRDVLFLVLGDGELRDDLQQQAHSLGIEKHVRFLGFQDAINEYYPAFDIYCHSSIELGAEAFPIAILQAVAAGLPVVATNVGGISMMVNDGVSGFLAPPENPQALADALRSLITNERLRHSMGEASFVMYHDRYRASLMAERVEEVYRKVLGSRQ